MVMMMIWSLVNTNCQEEEEKVELEMTGLANSSDVTVSEKSFQVKENLFYNKSVLADLIISNTIISRRLRTQSRLPFLARPTQPSWLRWKQMCTLPRFVTCQIISDHIISWSNISYEKASPNTVITCIPVYCQYTGHIVCRWRWAPRWRRRTRRMIEVNSSHWIIKSSLFSFVPFSLKIWTECCSLTISVFAGPIYTWKHTSYTSDQLPLTSDQPCMGRTFSEWSDCVICKSLNNKNIFDEFCILFWINRLNCLLCLSMFKKGSIYVYVR